MPEYMSSRTLLAILSTLVLTWPGAALAGMPSISLTDVARMRLDAISFFLLLLVLSAWLLKGAWNLLAKDFPRVPRIGFKQALGLVFVSGLFFYVVLTMISGARELMTPGAWVRKGATYQLATPERDGKMWLSSARQKALEQLCDSLWRYSKEHGGNLPLHRDTGEIEAELWAGVHPQQKPLAYVPGLKAGVGSQILAFEPDDYGATRYALLSDGTVIKLTASELANRVIAESKPAVVP